MKYLCSAILLLALLVGCSGDKEASKPKKVEPLTEVASSETRWTGVAVAPDGRIFTCFPRWSPDIPMSVAEVHPDGSLTPYPNEDMNRWTDTLTPQTHFVCVQALWADAVGHLWVLDPANPQFQGVVEGGPKLVQIHLASNTVVNTFYFDETIAPKGSYLNDVRVDNAMGFAYISESGTGSMVVLDIESGEARRLLVDHPSTKAEDITLNIDGQPFTNPDGSARKVHCDGIALAPDGQYVYYQA
ncbi:hypothetical protein GF377_09530, partial [candidate division GN15 bacterium]|nr:hypothetical protein [candidate division GN15 bacterium]